MFLGHYALGFISRKKESSISLAICFIATQLLDLIWPLFVLLGIESLSIEPGITTLTPLNFSYYPYSHSLFMALIWGLLFSLIYFGFTKNKQSVLLLTILVISHWVLDFLTHRPDLPLSPFTDLKLGLGLWNYPLLESIIEISFFIIASIIYYKSNSPTKKISYWCLVFFFLTIQILNNSGPLPPNAETVAWTANLMWLFVFWAWWIEKK